MAVCCQNLPLGALSNRSASYVMVGALFKKFGFLIRLVFMWLHVQSFVTVACVLMEIGEVQVLKLPVDVTEVSKHVGVNII
jgi:hypothetical protein